MSAIPIWLVVHLHLLAGVHTKRWLVQRRSCMQPLHHFTPLSLYIVPSMLQKVDTYMQHSHHSLALSLSLSGASASHSFCKLIMKHHFHIFRFAVSLLSDAHTFHCEEERKSAHGLPSHDRCVFGSFGWYRFWLSNEHSKRNGTNFSGHKLSLKAAKAAKVMAKPKNDNTWNVNMQCYKSTQSAKTRAVPAASNEQR